jgi:hypothetical protein
MRLVTAAVLVFATAFGLGAALTIAAPAQPASHIVNGVDFDELSFGKIHLHKGTYTADDPRITTTIDSFYHGQVAGKTLAVVVLRDELPATGYDESAEMFEVNAGKANHLSSLGDFSFYSEGDGPYPDNWIYVSFADNKLYADVWDHGHRCDKRHDWVASTYTIRGSKLQRIDVLRHHRKGLPVDCRAE